MKTKKTKLIIGSLLVGLVLSAGSCDGEGANKASKEEKKATGDQMNILIEAQPPLRVQYSQVRQTLLLAEYLAASSSANHSFILSKGSPDPVFECDSIGFPVPGTFNITNPLMEDPTHAARDGIVVAQAEGMLGVYTGDTQGTYLVCLTPEGKPFVTWNEGEVQGGYPLGTTWDYKLHKIVLPANAEVPKTPVPIVPNP